MTVSKYYTLLLTAILVLVLVLFTTSNGKIFSRVRIGKFLDINFGKESTRHLSQQSHNLKSELPYFILHVGPQKTGMFIF